MQQLTYRQAYDRIIDAYFKNEIKPNEPKFCFCGTLCDNSEGWFVSCMREHRSFNGYSGEDFVKMETALLIPIHGANVDDFDLAYEDALFEGMCAAMEVLKQIHRDRGENVDEEIPAFTKRQLVKIH